MSLSDVCLVLKGNPQARAVDEVLRSLQTGSAGLSSDEARTRLESYGRNALEEEHQSLIVLFLRQFNSLLVYILLAAAALTLLLGDLKDFFIILVLVIFNGTIGFWQERKAEASIEALRKLTESTDQVLRDGQVVDVASTELVPGDIVLLSEGEMITADLRLISTDRLSIDESTITGESQAVEKDANLVLPENALPYELSNCAISGTVVNRGSGRGVVVATGKDTYISFIAEKAEEASPESPLTKALKVFTQRYVIVIVLLIAALCLIALVQSRGWEEVVLLAVAQLVSAVPEGLPLVITLVMVVGAMALSKKKTLTRYLPAVETLGSATVIASDKTGTITEGRLSVTEVHSLDQEMERLCAALCNDSQGGRGDGVDVAMALHVGDGFEEIRSRCPRIWSHPFDTVTRRMASLNLVDGEKMLFVKGAYEALRPLATNDPELDALERQVELMARKGLRVLALGVGPEAEEDPTTWRLRIVALYGFLDPPKPNVAEAVRRAKDAGIRVMMITGDHPTTAQAIAASVGIWSPGQTVLTGKEVETMDDTALYERCLETSVIARAIPEHKYRVVKLLQGHKDIVAVTGDGVNDVPALRAADLGVAMGSGTEAAKSAAKMVIVDNNLGVIVDAIRTGRVIADNIRKVIYYLLATNVNQIVLIGISLLAGLAVPLSPIQVLWVNLVTDGVQDKTFPFAKEEGDVMCRPPRDPKRQFFDLPQVLRIMYFSLGLGVVLFLLYWMLLDEYGFEVASTITFTSLVMVQWVNGIQAQKEKEPFIVNLGWSVRINPYVFLGVLVGFVLQLTAIYLMNDWLDTVGLDLSHWYYVVIAILLAFILLEARKFWESWREKVSSCSMTE